MWSFRFLVQLVQPHSPYVSRSFYGERAVEGGLYDSAFDQLREMPNALANLEYIGTKKRPQTIFRGMDWSKSIVFKESKAKDAPEFKVAIIGEICGPEYGTIVQAQGNHYDGRDGEPFKPVDDRSKCKDVLVLRDPTQCSMDQLNMFDNQTALLQDMENTETAMDATAGQASLIYLISSTPPPHYSVWQSPNFRSCLRSKKVDMDSKNLITVTTLKKYGLTASKVPASAGGPRVAVAAATPQKVKRVKRKFGDDDDSDEDDGPAVVHLLPSSVASDVLYPTDDDIKLGTYYDPRVLEDYSGPYFQHTNAKLIQLDIRDANNRLIPPWKQYAAFREGSLVLVLGTIHVYTFTDPGFDRRRDRKVFQINAQTIKVIDESEYPVRKRSPPVPRTMTDESGAGPSSPQASASKGLKSFVVTPRSSPSKKSGEDEDMEGDKEKKRKKRK
ncbi:hypothetical protein B0H19DRAFT_1084961 [Mycena capillaripes]|nr:hypothetical protein B0H19DRAFT_1084961 [Mycena capillaripes]